MALGDVGLNSASIAEFWMRYIRYQEQGGPNGVEGAKPILQRAQQVFCKASTSLQLYAANFHERTGSPPNPYPDLHTHGQHLILSLCEDLCLETGGWMRLVGALPEKYAPAAYSKPSAAPHFWTVKETPQGASIPPGRSAQVTDRRRQALCCPLSAKFRLCWITSCHTAPRM